MPRQRTVSHRALTKRGAATRVRIVIAAAKLVYHQGAGTLNLDEVMAVTGTSKSQLYHYFEDKASLLREVVELQTARVLETNKALLAGVCSLDQLLQWGNQLLALSQRKEGRGGCPLGSLGSELANQSSVAQSQITEAFEAWAACISGALRRLQTRGEIIAGVDTNRLALAVLTAIQGGLLLAKISRDSKPLEIALDMAWGHIRQYAPQRAR